DPAVRARLAATAEPTRPDLEARAHLDAAGGPDQWHLRYRGRSGSWHRARATTEQILKRLEEGRIPRAAEACRHMQDGFHPLATYAEFQAALKGEKARPAAADAKPESPSVAAPADVIPPQGHFLLLLTGLGVGVAVTAAGLALVYRFFCT